MATNSTCSTIELSGAIELYARSQHIYYIYLIISTMLGSLLLPFLLALFYFSSSYQRRTPMFVCVSFSVVLAIAQAVYQIAVELKGFYDPLHAQALINLPNVLIPSILAELPNFVADLALLCRLLVVYPRHTTSLQRFLVIFTPIIALKLARIACISVILVYHSQLVHGVTTFSWGRPERNWIIADRLFTAIDNGYASALFLWKLRSSFQTGQDSGRLTIGTSNSLSSRIRTLFWIAATNFVLPIPLCIAQIGLAAALTDANIYTIFQYFVNFTSVICVAFATVWSSSASFRESARGHDIATTHTKRTSLRFNRVTVETPTVHLSQEDFTSEMGTIPDKPDVHPLEVRVDWARRTM